jgi:hypothetical protein
VRGFQEHFLDKYFGYRRRYVEAVAAIAPERRSLAVASELARLGFSVAGNALCAAILWLLCWGSVQRSGGAGVWPIVSGLLALLPTGFGLLAVRAMFAALADRRGDSTAG